MSTSKQRIKKHETAKTSDTWKNYSCVRKCISLCVRSALNKPQRRTVTWSQQLLKKTFTFFFSLIRLILSILPALTTRHHHCADHDHAEYYCQEIPSESVLCDRHGPVCVRLLHLRLRRTYRVRHAALLCQQQEAEREKGQEEEKPGERLSTTNWSDFLLTTGSLWQCSCRQHIFVLCDISLCIILTVFIVSFM